MPAIPNARNFNQALRQAGFTQQPLIRTSGQRRITWTKMVGDREIEVILWSQYDHSVNHSVAGGCNTRPVNFTDVETMLAAIETEKTRT